MAKRTFGFVLLGIALIGVVATVFAYHGFTHAKYTKDIWLVNLVWETGFTVFLIIIGLSKIRKSKNREQNANQQ